MLQKNELLELKRLCGLNKNITINTKILKELIDSYEKYKKINIAFLKISVILVDILDILEKENADT